jgi:hypothetical protein
LEYAKINLQAGVIRLKRLYHGGYCAVEQPEIRIGKHAKDFGWGFYCTEFQPQAERWAKRFDTPVVSVYGYSDLDGLCLRLFTEMSDEWLDFIALCRDGKTHDHDVVAGAMANDQVWNYVADFLAGILTREQFWVLAKFKHPTHQIAFCTEKALQRLNFIESYEVTD